ncbi:MAG: NAD-dependent dehydratase, partial [Muribaculaceae bacterium]|nr:NAD-dependent dehydratase [Muribaculaceae bacterium]
LRLIAELMGVEVEYVVDPERIRPSKSEVRRLCGDNRVITSLTDWRPEVSLKDGLRKTIEWFTDPVNLSRYKTDIYNR